MNRKNFNIRTTIIKETFNDEREIKSCVSSEELQLDNGVYNGADIFRTENGEFICLEMQVKDFDEDELLKYVELAEKIYEKYNKKVSVYIICPHNINVYVREFPIKSEADFTIKLAKINENPAEVILNMIKQKIRNEEMLDQDDINALEMLHNLCDEKEKHRYRLEAFKIMNRLNY